MVVPLNLEQGRWHQVEHPKFSHHPPYTKSQKWRYQRNKQVAQNKINRPSDKEIYDSASKKIDVPESSGTQPQPSKVLADKFDPDPIMEGDDGLEDWLNSFDYDIKGII